MNRLAKGKFLAIIFCALFVAQMAFGFVPTTVFAAPIPVLTNQAFITANANNYFDFEISDGDALENKVLYSPQLTTCTYNKDTHKLSGYIDSTLERGTYQVKVTYGDNIANEFVLTIGKTTSNIVQPTPTPIQSSTNAIVLNATDSKGNTVTTPSGNFGETITLTVPMRNRGGFITDFDLRMDVGDPSTFPFDLSNTSYVKRMPDFYFGAVFDATFRLKLSSTVTKGVKAVNFVANYKENGTEAESKFTVYVNVVKGAPEPTMPGASGAPVSAAKLIISGYKTNPERLFAGEEFDLELTFENTSDKDDVKNIKITLKNEDGIIIPAASGSNTLYIKKIGKLEKITKTVRLQSRPDAPAKPQTLSVDLEYEGATPLALTSTEAITLPIAQKMRVVIEDPRVMADGVMVETPISVSFGIFNMGKAPLYNLLVDIEGEGLRMEEKFFGGTVAAGSTARADFNIVPSIGGQIDAKFVITYENEYGEQTVEEKPVSVFVQENMPPPMEGEGKPMPETNTGGGSKTILYAGIGGGILLVVVLIIVLRRRRIKKAREFEDVNI